MKLEDEESRQANYALTVAGKIKATDADAEGASRIRAHLGSILRLNSLIILMGAGASFHIDGPKIRKSTVESIDALLSINNEVLDDLDKSIIAALCPGEDFNLETLLERLNSVIAFASASGRATVPLRDDGEIDVSQVTGLRARLNVALAAACNLERHTKHEAPWNTHQSFFRKLLSIRRDLPSTRIFTTNYDLAIEFALDGAGIDYIDGFKGTVRRTFHPEVYNQLLYTATSFEQRRFVPSPNLLYVYKIHGSVNWRVDDSPRDRTVIQVSPDDVPTSDSLALIYPTQDKESSVLGFPYAELIRAFNDALLAPEVGLITIGYGFADAHVNRIIDAALASNYTLQLLMIDPVGIGTLDNSDDAYNVSFNDTSIAAYASKNDARHASIIGDGATFENFASIIMPDLDAEEMFEEPAHTKRQHEHDA